jgi:uncharacterized phiE125 gp8 family phage protein
MGTISTGQSVLVDRTPYNVAVKVMPVGAAALREHLQLQHAADDVVVFGVGGYLPAATGEVEKRGNVSLIAQRRKQYIGLEEYPVCGKTIEVLYGPVISVTAVKYLDSSDAVQTYPATSYRVTDTGEVYFKDNPPTLAAGPQTIWIEYEAGYGALPDNVPAEWQSIVMQLAYRRYELRGESAGQKYDEWERMIDRQICLAGGSRRA